MLDSLNLTKEMVDTQYQTFTHEDKTVISLSVISYPIKPISFKGKYYKRVHNANHLMGFVSKHISKRFVISGKPRKKSKEIKAALTLPQRTLERWLKELREQWKIKFQGPPKTGGYYCFDAIDEKTEP